MAKPGMRAVLAAVVAWAALPGVVQAQSTLTIGTADNGYLAVLRRLSPEFEKHHPDVKLRWVVLEPADNQAEHPK